MEHGPFKQDRRPAARGQASRSPGRRPTASTAAGELARIAENILTLQPASDLEVPIAEEEAQARRQAKKEKTDQEQAESLSMKAAAPNQKGKKEAEYGKGDGKKNEQHGSDLMEIVYLPWGARPTITDPPVE